MLLSEIQPGYYYESPAVAISSPMICKYDAKETPAALKSVGYQRWRFSLSGIVEVEIEQHRKKDKETGKLGPTQDYYILIDSVDGRKALLDSATAKRLQVPCSNIPGFGYGFLPPHEFQEQEKACSRCNRELLYPAGESPVVGMYESPDLLRPQEYAEMTVKKTGAKYLLCNRCIPKGWLYCGHCRTVHPGWHFSESLKAYREIVDEYFAGTLPGDLYRHSYQGSGKGKAEIVLQVHFDDRIGKLIQLIGRGSVCKSPDYNIKANLAHYLKDLSTMQSYWKDYLKKENE